jgi:hypothetical protein
MHRMNNKIQFLIIGAITLLAIYFGWSLAVQGYEKHHGKMHSNMGQHREHDEVNMPGLQGKDTTDQEVNDLKNIFTNHKKITRNVTNVPNGIKTITFSKDEKVRESIINHVSMMTTRMAENKNPEVMIQSPTLTELFKYYDQIETELEVTDTGIAVIQTSKNPEVVQLLQKHAGEISDMVDRGMQAIHERMMRSAK